MKLIFFALTKGNNSFDDIDHYITRQRQVVPGFTCWIST